MNTNNNSQYNQNNNSSDINIKELSAIYANTSVDGRLHWPTQSPMYSDGDYAVSISGAQVIKSNIGGAPRLMLSLTIFPDMQEATKSYPLQAATLWRLKRDMVQLGITDQDFQKVMASVRSLSSHKVKVRVLTNQVNKWQDIEFLGILPSNNHGKVIQANQNGVQNDCVEDDEFAIDFGL